MRINANISRMKHGRQGKYCGRQSGFSLIELMIVVAVVGVMAAIALPSLSDWRAKQAVNSAAQTLLAHLKQARMLAISENRKVRLTFDKAGYVFDADVGGACKACRNEPVSYAQFSSQLKVTPYVMRTFSSRGTVNFGSITVALGGTQKKITLNAIGRAYLQ